MSDEKEIQKVPYDVLNQNQLDLLPPELLEGKIHEDFIVTHPQLGYVVCGHKTRNSETHENGHYYCLRSAGWGTDHPGKGFCKLHGGTGANKTAGGRYSKYIQTTPLQQKHIELMRDPEILNLSEEIAVLRTVLTELLELKDKLVKEMADANADPAARLLAEKKFFGTLSFMQDNIDKITRVVETKNRIENGEKHVIRVELIQLVLVQITGIIKKYITDKEVLKHIASDLKTLQLPE